MPSLKDHLPPSGDEAHNWALVLAAGEGSRLRALTTTASGVVVPKQFCSFGNASLLHAALERARVVAPSERICTVVAAQHERYWQTLPCSIPARNITVQPCNRGTANGILLPLLQILHRDPDASLLVLPSDHYVRNEAVLAASLQRAMAHVGSHKDRIVLLGLAPESADSELGYIVPGEGSSAMARDVSEFIEKPTTTAAGSLIERGGLWNSFIFAVNGQTLLRAFEAHCLQVVRDMCSVVTVDSVAIAPSDALTALYERLPGTDFSKEIVERATANLQVMQVPACGWSDLGTPRRVADVIGRVVTPARGSVWPIPYVQGFLDLAAQHTQRSMVLAQESSS